MKANDVPSRNEDEWCMHDRFLRPNKTVATWKVEQDGGLDEGCQQVVCSAHEARERGPLS